MSDPGPVNATTESVRFLRNLRDQRGQLATVQRSFVTNGTLRQVYEDSLVLERDGSHEVLDFLHAIISITTAPERHAPTAEPRGSVHDHTPHAGHNRVQQRRMR
jgi:hypothetical protein